jgi:uncharacterized protein YijF (DUF1287 family)
VRPYIFVAILCLPFHAKGASFSSDFVDAAIQRTHQNVRYDGSYISIDYPNGDVPREIGVCTDVIIRSYREIGTDLQKLVHEDISSSFKSYPSNRIWGLSRPDKNIDHRRVPNLRAFFERHGEVLEVSGNPSEYRPGDLVIWMLPGNLPHIGIVTDRIAPDSGRPLIAHNIGRGPELQDMILKYSITGHYRYVPTKYNK